MGNENKSGLSWTHSCTYTAQHTHNLGVAIKLSGVDREQTMKVIPKRGGVGIATLSQIACVDDV